jgi:hypothetical protein
MPGYHFKLAISRPPLHGSNAPKVLSVVRVKVGPPTQDKMQYCPSRSTSHLPDGPFLNYVHGEYISAMDMPPKIIKQYLYFPELW